MFLKVSLEFISEMINKQTFWKLLIFVVLKFVVDSWWVCFVFLSSNVEAVELVEASTLFVWLLALSDVDKGMISDVSLRKDESKTSDWKVFGEEVVRNFWFGVIHE